MHIAILIVAIVLVGTGIFMRSQSEDRILGESIPTPPMAGPTQTPSPTATPSPTNTPTLTPTPTKQIPSTNIEEFLYPSASIIAQSDNSLSLSSSDDTGTITDWYKNKIESLGMKTRSFVQTKTNDNVLNVLAAAKNGSEIKITIKKNAGEVKVSIIVEL